jgi:hypothetical protein
MRRIFSSEISSWTCLLHNSGIIPEFREFHAAYSPLRSAEITAVGVGQNGKKRRRARAWRQEKGLVFRVGGAMNVVGLARFLSRQFDEAVPKLLLAIKEDPNFPSPYPVLAACYAHMGRLDEARQMLTRLRAITATVIPDIGTHLANGIVIIGTLIRGGWAEPLLNEVAVRRPRP